MASADGNSTAEKIRPVSPYGSTHIIRQFLTALLSEFFQQQNGYRCLTINFSPGFRFFSSCLEEIGQLLFLEYPLNFDKWKDQPEPSATVVRSLARHWPLEMARPQSSNQDQGRFHSNPKIRECTTIGRPCTETTRKNCASQSRMDRLIHPEPMLMVPLAKPIRAHRNANSGLVGRAVLKNKNA